MKAAQLNKGDVIGLVAPCHHADRRKMEAVKKGLAKLGYRCRESSFLYSDSWGYAGSAEERLADLEEMLRDDRVRMILFGGGNGGNEFLLQLDFELFRQHPKLIMSYSNGTALLNAIWLHSGLEVYYGQFPGVFTALSKEDEAAFHHSFEKKENSFFWHLSPWEQLTPGTAEGILFGGFTEMLAMMVHHPLFQLDPSLRIVLFLENCDRFAEEGTVLSQLAFLEQSPIFSQTVGIVFGYYSTGSCPVLKEGLKRIGCRWQIPVYQCADFGHGIIHSILPIGRHVILHEKGLDWEK